MVDRIRNFGQLLAHVKGQSIKKGKARVGIWGLEKDRFADMVSYANKAGIAEPVAIDRGNEIERFTGTEIDFILAGNVEDLLAKTELFSVQNSFYDSNRTPGHIAVFEHEKYPRLLLMSDGFINVSPDIMGKLEIIRSTVEIAEYLGIEMPKVAMLAAVEVVYPGMRVSEEAAIISKMVDRDQNSNCLIGGPLSMDVATLPEVARQKGATSEVAGQADILIAPNIETGNGIYKAMSMFAKARTAGLIVGGKVPVAISSRCDGPESLFNSLILGSCIALAKK